MKNLSTAIAINQLQSLSIESRVIATPWSRIVRGVGLGQYPIDYNPEIGENIKSALSNLEKSLAPGHPYSLFATRLVDFILKKCSEPGQMSHADILQHTHSICEAVRTEKNPYLQIMAGCITMDVFAKLGLSSGVLISESLNLPSEILGLIDNIQPSGSNDENSERHGDYEKISAFTSIFLAFGQLNISSKLVSPERNYILEALNTLENVPTPFFRGRGGAMLLSIICLIGYSKFIFGTPKNYMEQTFDLLDLSDELNLYPFFPQSLSTNFSKTYPLVTMLNAVAMSGRKEYLTYKRNRIEEMKNLWNSLERLEKTHMGLYYIIALHNLGLLKQEIPDLNSFLLSIINQLEEVDPGEDYFAHGLSYHYMIQTAMITGNLNLIRPQILSKLGDSYYYLDKTIADKNNRPYTLSYGINILGEIGRSSYIFSPRTRYSQKSAVQWVIENLSPHGIAEDNRLYMLHNSLISYALRMRGRQAAETELFSNFQFPFSPR